MPRRRRACLLFCACHGLLACGTLDAVDHVHDLRILGIRAEPPDQALSLAVGDVAPTVLAVQVSVLVADPAGAGRAIAYTLSTCPALDAGAAATRGAGPGGVPASGTQRCVDGSAQPFAAGSAGAVDGWVELGGSFTATPALLLQARAQDPYGGLDGVRLPVQVDVAAGDAHIVGTKLVVYTDAGGRAYSPNENPVLDGIDLEGAPWPADAPRALVHGAHASSRGFSVQPQFDPGRAVAYQMPSFDGTLLDFREIWQFDYFSTAGGLSPTTAGGQGAAARGPAPSTSFWLPDAGLNGAATLWLVVRDGRGGESWLTRTATLTP